MISEYMEELTNDFKNDLLELSDYYLFNILSYIEKLEKENKILRENAEHNDKVVDKVNWEINILKHNIDKAEEVMK